MRADNKRVARRGAMGGWDQLRSRLKGDDFGEPMGQRPTIFTFNTCTASIRTIPALQHSDTNPEDLDTDMEDHAADEWRYGAMSHPFVKIQTPDLKIVKDSYGFDEPEENDWKTA